MGQQLTINKHFSTTDLSLTSTLITFGFPVDSLIRSNSQKVQFTFAANEDLQKVVSAYFSDKLKVNPRKYFDNIKLIKNMIHMG